MNESHDPNSTDWDIAQAQAPSPATEQKGATGKGRNLFTRQLAPILSGKRVDEDEERVVDPLDRNQADEAPPATTATDNTKDVAHVQAQPPRQDGEAAPEEPTSQPQPQPQPQSQPQPQPQSEVQEQLPGQQLSEQPSQQEPIQQTKEAQQPESQTQESPTKAYPKGEPEARIQSPPSQKESAPSKKFSIPGHRHLTSLSSTITSAPGRFAQAPGQIVGGVTSGAGTIASGVTRGAETLASGAGGIAMGAGSLIGAFSPFGTKSAKEKAKEEEEIEVRKCYKLRYPLPLRPAEPNQLVQGLQLNALKVLVLASVVCYISGRIHFSYVFGLICVFAGGLAYWVLGRETQDGLDWQLEKQEGSMTLHLPDGESVEWLNYFLEKIWRSIDPSIFVSVEDILEDTLQSLVPAVIKAVKVTDFDVGVHAPRIDMIRIFPPVAGQPEEALFGEASFAFHAHPVASLSSSRNVTSAPPGIAIRFKTGIKAPIDIKAELTKCTGKLRFKILTAPDFPFVNKVTISFTSVPKIDTGVMPMSKHMNVMRLPMMKTIVNEAVKLGFADLVDPKSMTLNVKEMMGAAAMDTSAIGVIKVRVIEAKREASGSLEDMEDSYATLALSTQKERSAPSTRVLTNDKDPRWNEDLFLLIKQEDIVNKSMVNIKVWDADKVKFDDEWGCVSVPVKDIVEGKVDKQGNVVDWCKEERVVFDGWAPMDEKPADESKIQLHFTMSFHPKYIAPPPPSFLNELQKRSPEQLRLEREPLFPLHKSGILTVNVSEAADLEIGDPEVIASDEFKHPYSPSQVVNPYAIVYLNDRKVYESRAKLRNSSPHWNAESEHFVKDYDTAFLRISVKASLDLERDPVLGTKVFYLSDMFESNEDKFKEVERWVPLQNGIGFGKVLLNLKYKPVKLSLPRELSGSDVCTLVVDRVTFTDLKGGFSTDYMRSTRATLALNIDPVILKRVKARELKRDDAGENLWSERRMFFPLTMRYRTAVYVHLSQGAVNTVRATGRLWLKEVYDNHWQELTIGLHPPVSEHSKEANRNEDSWPEEGEFGQVKLRVKITPGFSPVHTHLRSFALDMLGADPFDDETMRLKAEQWMREDESGLDDPLEQHQRAHSERRQSEQEHKQHSPQLQGDDRRESRNTEMTDEYGDDMLADRDYLEEMKKYNRPPRIARFEVMRKFVRGTDLVRYRVDSVRSGFNSDMRASRAISKE